MSQPEATVPVAGRLAPALRAFAERLRVARPVPLLAGLVVVQVLIGVWMAWRTPHNGFLWYSGGDATEYWTESWSLAHRAMPSATIGYALPVYYGWVPLVAGPSLLTGVPVIAMLQLFVFVPVGVVCFWGVADRLFGRVFAWGATTLYVLGPLLLIAGFEQRFRDEFEQLFLAPHWFGLTEMADFPTLVGVLACAWATLWAFDRRSLDAALLAGLLGGFLLGLKPSNGFFLPGVLVLLAAGRRWRELVVWGIGLVPALVTLLLWKVRGIGNVPLLALGGAHEALAAGSAVGATTAFAGGRYVQFNGHHLHQELQDLREVFWSLRLLEFLFFAGILGAVRRFPAKGLFVGVWAAAYLLFKGSTHESAVIAGSYFRLAEAGLPAFALLAASVVFLRPGVRTLADAPAHAAAPGRARLRHPRALAAAAVVLGAVPLAAVAVAGTPAQPRMARDNQLVNEAPIVHSLDLRASASNGTVRLTWRKPASAGARLTYRVLRSGTGDGCSIPETGARICLLDMDTATVTRSTSWSGAAGAGPTWYRIAVAADFQDDDHGDLMLLSPAVRVP
ncbi:MAG TPA: hypothetical protein VHC45_16770 [Gaiellaceae bacterium]|nr:hypothetical protein [Gaiellaceae bacterium]